MTHSNMMKTTCLAATFFAVAFNGPLLAQISAQDPNMACDATLAHGSIAQLSATHATIHTSVLIDAAPADVWATLTDFETMSDWSTGTLQGIDGDIQDGGSVVVTFLFGTDDAGNPISNEIPHSLILDEGKMFGWSDPFPADIGGGRDNHVYAVQPCGEKTLFIQSDEVIDNPYAANFVTQFLAGYQLFNAELKAAVEN
ncbi:SRPBCC family protein [Yoonia sp. I 8.24]|uniref:SRPBCC family protein n=1 Tax=Yoonia sp. I 8.24 TaxID=1537229 RepID=UPI001EE12544|nr:SRPBCC family protein [Yoonia sp. I 8.24]MCG3267071.1 SRPBCC family protein [Yoonia sp. I 8.24]